MEKRLRDVAEFETPVTTTAPTIVNHEWERERERERAPTHKHKSIPPEAVLLLPESTVAYSGAVLPVTPASLPEPPRTTLDVEYALLFAPAPINDAAIID
jgi:hypothetical protein